MAESLTNRTVNGVLWSTADRIGQQGIQLLILVLISRILSPADFGLIGMLAFFMAIAGSLLDSGFGWALIQKKETTHLDFSTIFYFNIGIGIVIYIILFFSAGYIAGFYNQPQLIPLTRFIALNLIISSLGLIQNTVLTKELNFKVITKVNFLSNLISGIAGVTMAYYGFGVWSLAVQTVASQFLRTVFLWIFNSWRPTLVFSVQSLKGLFSFGSKLLVSGLISQVFDNIYYIIIGKFYSATQLGYYTQSKRMSDIPAMNITSIIQSVTYPALSSIQNEDTRLKTSYKKIIKIIVFVSFPLMLVLCAIAKPLIVVLLTVKWLPSVPYFQLLCILGMFYPLSAINLNILNVKGRSDIFLYLEIVKKTLITVAIILTISYNIIALLMGLLGVTFIAVFLNLYYSGRLISYSLKEQLADIFPYFLSSVIVAALTFILSYVLNNIMVLLIVQFFFSLGSYYLISKLLKFEALVDLESVVKNLLFNVNQRKRNAS